MRPTKTEIKINNNKLIKLKSRHYEIIVKRPVNVDAEQTKESMSQMQKASR
jgi:phage gp45-like